MKLRDALPLHLHISPSSAQITPGPSSKGSRGISVKLPRLLPRFGFLGNGGFNYLERLLCPIFLGNFTPKTSNYCLKNRALGFPGRNSSERNMRVRQIGIAFPSFPHHFRRCNKYRKKIWIETTFSTSFFSSQKKVKCFPFFPRKKRKKKKPEVHDDISGQ